MKLKNFILSFCILMLFSCATNVFIKKSGVWLDVLPKSSKKALVFEGQVPRSLEPLHEQK